MVDKKKLGTKRVCLSCGTKFYDLGKNPVKCPKCGDEFDPDALLKHSFAAKAKKTKKTELDDDSFVMYDTDDVVDVVPSEDDELTIIEDASDIGDDSHDLAEVVGSFDKDNMSE